MLPTKVHLHSQNFQNFEASVASQQKKGVLNYQPRKEEQTKKKRKGKEVYTQRTSYRAHQDCTDEVEVGTGKQEQPQEQEETKKDEEQDEEVFRVLYL